MLTRDQILGSVMPEPVEVQVPEWGGSVLVGVMTGTQRDRFETVNGQEKSNIRARLAAYTIRDSEGKQMFSEADVIALGAKSSIALDRIFDVAVKVNAIGKKDIDVLEKNSG